MNRTRNKLDASIREKSIELLQARLADALVLYTHAKQAHWNVKGPNFIALHELFDDVAESADEYGDTIAERLVALGGTAHGTAKAASTATKLPDYPLETTKWRDHVEALSNALAAFGDALHQNIRAAADFGDDDTADVFTEVSRGVDKYLWFVESHLAEEH